MRAPTDNRHDSVVTSLINCRFGLIYSKFIIDGIIYVLIIFPMVISVRQQNCSAFGVIGIGKQLINAVGGYGVILLLI